MSQCERDKIKVAVSSVERFTKSLSELRAAAPSIAAALESAFKRYPTIE